MKVTGWQACKVIDDVTKDYAVDEDLTCSKQWLVLASENTSYVNFAVISFVPLSKEWNDVGKYMNRQKHVTNGLIFPYKHRLPWSMDLKILRKVHKYDQRKDSYRN